MPKTDDVLNLAHDLSALRIIERQNKAWEKIRRIGLEI